MKTLFLLFLLPAADPVRAAGDMPVCMYGINKPQELRIIKRAGFNCFQTYGQSPELLAALAEEAGKLGLKMLAAPDMIIGSAYDKAAKSWPMLAWYLYDEPEVHKVPLAELAKMDRRAKEWSPGQRTAFVMGEGGAAFTYGGAADILMVDWYPVPHLELGSVGQQVTLVREGAKALDAKNPDKPVWAVLQAFDWMEYPQRRVKKVGGFPTFEQVRFMTYLALVRGAKGIFYFSYHSKDGTTLADRPERWSSYERMAAELDRMAPVFLKGRQTAPPAGLSPALSAAAYKENGRSYLVLLNPSAKETPLPPPALKGWRPLFEELRDLPAVLPPNAVLILER
ncbi:MAG: hypothetical protein WCW52_02785 [Elusimicrobiales bacterium]